MRGRRHSLDERNKRLRDMRMEVPAEAKLECGLQDLAWDVESLRYLLTHMLLRHDAGTADLMKLWDKNGDGELDVHECATRHAVSSRQTCMHVRESALN